MRPDHQYRSGLNYTAGALTAIGIFLAILVVLAIGGAIAWQEYRAEQSRQLLKEVRRTVDRDIDRPGAIRAANQVLGKVGYGEASAGTEVALAEDEDSTHFVDGECERQGERHKFSLWFNRVQNGTKTQWKVVRLVIDGRTL